MPYGDGTGPLGLGQGSGRGRGRCAGNVAQGNSNTVSAGMGLTGMGLRRGFLGKFGINKSQMMSVNNASTASNVSAVSQPAEPVDERADLENKAEVLQTQLNLIKKRIEELSK